MSVGDLFYETTEAENELLWRMDDSIYEIVEKIPSKIDDPNLDNFYSHIIELFKYKNKFNNFNEKKLIALLLKYIELSPWIQKSVFEKRVT